MANDKLSKIKKFLRGVKSELKKVNWPNKSQLISYTMVVIVTVVLVTTFIGAVDLVFSNLIRTFILN